MLKRKTRIVLPLIFVFLAGMLFQTIVSAIPDSSALDSDTSSDKVKNVILLIGDGMGLSQLNAARIKQYGADGKLFMQKMPFTGFVSTHSSDKLITDSAAAATAYATGFKTKNHMVSINPSGKKLLTIAEASRKKGMAVGLIATSSITHATPAAFASHVMNRDSEYKIAINIIENNFDVLLGGGKSFFMPSKQNNNRDLLTEAKNKGYAVLNTKQELAGSKSSRILGLFAPKEFTDSKSEPTLAEMTDKAIKVLGKQKNGFFLMVEGSRIDWACHDNNMDYMIRETLSFDDAVKVACDFAASDKQTLVIVLADHDTGGMGITGGDLTGKGLTAAWVSKDHTAVQVPMFAQGPKAQEFTGVHDNTEIPRMFARYLGIDSFPAVLEK